MMDSTQLVDARKAAGMTQQDLAEKLRVSVRAVSNWETGEAVPLRSIQESIRRILGAEVAFPKRAA
jgi:transcriptional regulator with XRE-family HTH domain